MAARNGPSRTRPDRADDVVADLLRHRCDAELAKVRKRLPPGEEAFGLRMRDLFDTAKAHTSIALDDVEALLDCQAYEPRMAAFCILDFKARRRDADRGSLCEVYLRRHDRITTWDMVDRAAPRVVGGFLAGRSPAPLHDLALAAEPLKRRTATTATLYFVADGSADDLAEGFAIAGRLAADPEAVVHNAVGIFLKHAGTRDPEALHRFLGIHAAEMPRPALRLAIEKLTSDERASYLARKA